MTKALGITVSTTQVRSNGVQLRDLARLLDDGTIRVILHSVYRLADARQAHERAAQGHIQGKIALTVEQDSSSSRVMLIRDPSIAAGRRS